MSQSAHDPSLDATALDHSDAAAVLRARRPKKAITPQATLEEARRHEARRRAARRREGLAATYMPELDAGTPLPGSLKDDETYLAPEARRALLEGSDADSASRGPEETLAQDSRRPSQRHTEIDAWGSTYAGDESADPRPVCEHCLTVVATQAGQGHLSCRCGRCTLPRASAAPARRDVSSTHFGSYELLGELGAGGMGVVYRARQASLRREVALKVQRSGLPASSNARRRFKLEAEAAASLSHPGIVSVHEVGEVAGQCFYSMDLVEGRSLAKHAKEQALNPRQIVELVLEVTRAVEHFHYNGIIHRDLKPENVIVGAQGPQIIDFGIAKRVSDTESRTLEGELLGTLRYMSPEQAAGSVRDLDVRTDVYALGVILYELLSGQAPFAGLRGGELLVAISDQDPQPLAGTCARLDRDLILIVEKALKKDRNDRYSSASALASDLQHYLKGEPVEARFQSARILNSRTLHLVSALALTLSLALLATVNLMEQRAATLRLRSVAPRVAAAPERVSVQQREALRARSRKIFGRLPAALNRTAAEPSHALVDLGRTLFHDERLSAGGKTSCNSCHALDAYGVDGQATSLGWDGKRGARNAPSVFNAALGLAQFVDGRAADLEAQAVAPMLNPDEMGQTEEGVLKAIRAIPTYASAFTAAFPGEAEPVTLERVGEAIGAFERQLFTPSRFDDFMGDDPRALRDEELAGLELFNSIGCTTCHVGAGLGGTMFQRLGLAHDFPTEDLGRFEITGRESDKFVFKVPVLRNVAMTGPYLHNGSISDLSEVVRAMAWNQLDQRLTDEETSSIVAFLESLTGRVDERLTRSPFPPSQTK